MRSAIAEPPPDMAPTVAVDLVGRVADRWPAGRPFVVIGSTSVVIGGLVAAVARPAGFELGSWLAAFLVLVGGVAQIALGVGQGWMAAEAPSRRTVVAEAALWNLALVATIAGTLAAVPALTTIGGILLVAALIGFFRAVDGRGAVARWPWLLYRAVIVVVVISTPIGLALAWIRHGSP